jgi:hypothetical protein
MKANLKALRCDIIESMTQIRQQSVVVALTHPSKACRGYPFKESAGSCGSSEGGPMSVNHKGEIQTSDFISSAVPHKRSGIVAVLLPP